MDEGNLLRTMADEREIIALAHRYARACDEPDIPTYVSCFTENALQQSGMYRVQGREAIGALLEQLWTRVSAAHHATSNFEIEIAGDEAKMRSLVIGTQAALDDPSRLFVIGASYRDRLVRRVDGWKISERMTKIEWTSGDPTVIGLPATGGGSLS